MKRRSFLDTNISVYMDDWDFPSKRALALTLVGECGRRGQAVVSTQALREYFNTAIRKVGLDPKIARRNVELLTHFGLVQIGPSDILGAIDLHRLHSLSFWDALILRAAQASNCTTLYSEDFQHGQVFDAVETINPFLPTRGFHQRTPRITSIVN